MSRSLRILAPFPLACLLAACGGDDGAGPDDEPLDFFLGTYTLAPPPTMTCDLDPFGEVVVSVNELEIYDVREDSIDVRVPMLITSDFFDDETYEFEFAMSASESGGMDGSLPLDIDVPTGPITVHGDGLFDVAGEFIDDDTFEAAVSAAFTIAVGDGAETECSTVAHTITGTRQ